MFGQNIKYQYPQKILLDEKYLQKIDEKKPIIAYTSSSAQIGIIEESFYRSGDNGAFQGLFPKFKEYNRRHLLYILASIQKHFEYFGYSTSMSDVINLEIILPFFNNEIYFIYMEKYIKELEELNIEEFKSVETNKLESYLIATGIKDYQLTNNDFDILDKFNKLTDSSVSISQTNKIKLGELFYIESTKMKFNAREIRFNGEYPYIARGEKNNGIRGYINEDIKYLNPGNTISFGQDTATMFYQKDPYFTGDKIKVFTKKDKYLSEHSALYLITATKKTLENFSWGSTSYNVSNLENINIEVPTSNHNIDYDLIEDFIQVIKKLVIKDIVECTNKKINAMKKVVE